MILLQCEARKRPDGKINPKNYPYFKELVSLLTPNYELVQIGMSGETVYCENVEFDISYQRMVELVTHCDTFIGIDSFLQHLAWKLNKRGVVIWGPSNPVHFGHVEHINLFDTRHFRQHQFQTWNEVEFCTQYWVTPEEVLNTIKYLLL